MKILILSLLVCVNVHAESLLEKAGIAKKGKCVDSNSLQYAIIQKVDDYHYEIRAVDYGDEPFGLLETKKAVYDNIGRPIGIGMEYLGLKAVKMNNGFSQTYHLWRECSYDNSVADQGNEAATLSHRKFLTETGWAPPRRLSDSTTTSKTTKSVTVYISNPGNGSSDESEIKVSDSSGDLILNSSLVNFDYKILKKERVLLRSEFAKALALIKKANSTYIKTKKEVSTRTMQFKSIGGQQVTGSIDALYDTSIVNGSVQRTTIYQLTINLQLPNEEKPRSIGFREIQLSNFLEALK